MNQASGIVEITTEEGREAAFIMCIGPTGLSKSQKEKEIPEDWATTTIVILIEKKMRIARFKKLQRLKSTENEVLRE